ncbi:MAG: site-2 protease family protein [Planctomycetota bacterium]|jgi:regulator of sigma E protease
MSYLLVIFIVATLILVHEFGHFLTALWVKIPVARFSLGFGPRLWGFERKGIEFRLSAVPLGGYVMPAITDPKEYFALPLWRRIVFSAGGPLFNLLLPVPIFAVLNVVESGLSAQAVVIQPFVQTFHLMIQILASIPALFANASSVAGPVGVVSIGSKFVGFGFVQAMTFTAFLSLNFAVFNLLPVPVLDGGKILLSVLERIFPRTAKAIVPVTVASLLLLFGLLAAATVSDISRIFS